MKVSMRKISEKTGLSPATVSNALNHKKGVNAHTAKVVFDTARDLGYFEKNHIKKIRHVTVRKDGSIVDDTPYFLLMLSEIQKECRKLGMELVISDLNMTDDDFPEQLRELQNDTSVAMIFSAVEILDENAWIFDGIKAPFVVIDYWNRKRPMNTVQSDNVGATRKAVEYLIEMGHKKIGYLKGDFRVVPFRDREEGYKLAMQSAGIATNDEYTYEVGTTIESAHRDVKRILESGRGLPTAFFADNDMIALGAMKAFCDAGIKIPEDLSIVGYDDLPYSAISTPPLTTISVPKEKMGHIIVQRLRDVIEGDDTVTRIEVSTGFVERQSVKKIG